MDNIYVADVENNRIQKFSPNGTFLTKWGGNGSADGQFNGPYGITTDSMDNIYVADYHNNRIQKFSSNGTFLTKWGERGSADGQFNHPSAITTDSIDNIYVADVLNFRIQKFQSSIIPIIICDDGMILDETSNQCISQNITLTCGNGTILDQNQCIVNPNITNQLEQKTQQISDLTSQVNQLIQLLQQLSDRITSNLQSE